MFLSVAIFSCLAFVDPRSRTTLSFVRIFIVLLGMGIPMAGMPAPAQEADPLIRGGRIVDGTGNPSFLGDVAIRGDRIAAMGHLGSMRAKRVLEAGGLTVAPGFIDM